MLHICHVTFAYFKDRWLDKLLNLVNWGKMSTILDLKLYNM